MSEAAAVKFDEWCLLEIMGHQKFAGRVSEQVIAGQAFVRIDIPQRKDGVGVAIPGFTKLFGPSSVYSITPMAEDLARAMAQQLDVEPISKYDLPEWMREKMNSAKQMCLLPELRDELDDEDDDDGSLGAF